MVKKLISALLLGALGAAGLGMAFLAVIEILGFGSNKVDNEAYVGLILGSLMFISAVALTLLLNRKPESKRNSIHIY